MLLDIAMPVMDGLEALPQVRAACPHAIVVMLSGFGASEMTSKALAGGADGYIQKGQPLGRMLAQLRTLVAKVSSARQGVDAVGQHPVERPVMLDHLELAPFGFVHLREGQVVRANREAGRLLGDLSAPDTDFASISPVLATHLDTRPHQDAAVLLDLGEPPRRILVTVRHAGEDQVVYLQTQTGDEAELLRRAIATAAHEIRNPVGVLMGVAETLTIHGHELTRPRARADAGGDRPTDPAARQHHRRPARRRAGPARHPRRTAGAGGPRRHRPLGRRRHLRPDPGQRPPTPGGDRPGAAAADARQPAQQRPQVRRAAVRGAGHPGRVTRAASPSRTAAPASPRRSVRDSSRSTRGRPTTVPAAPGSACSWSGRSPRPRAAASHTPHATHAAQCSHSRFPLRVNPERTFV